MVWCASRSERRDEREIERGAHAAPRRGRTKRRGAERSAARWFGLTVAKKGKERREKVEVCCAAVGTDCRASESPLFLILPQRPAGSRFIVAAAPRLSPLSLCRIRPPRAASRSIARVGTARTSLSSSHPSRGSG